MKANGFSWDKVLLLTTLLVFGLGAWPGPGPALSQDQTGEPSLLPEPVRLRINFLLQKAEADLAAGRLGGPGEENALARYNEIALLDPGSAKAEEGFEKVLQRALVLAEKAARDKDLDRAGELLEIADQALAGDGRVAELKKRLPLLAREGLKAVVEAAPTETAAAGEPDRGREPAPGQEQGAVPDRTGPSGPGEGSAQPVDPRTERLLKGERALRQALEAYLEGDYDRAQELYELARELIPEEPAVIRLGDRLAAMVQGTRDQAEEMLSQAEEALAQGDPVRAGELLDRAALVLGWGGRVAALKARIREQVGGGDETASGGEMVNSIGMKFVLIPAGKFQMGSPVRSQIRPDELPRHEVEITKSFWMGIHEVTQAQWQEIMDRNPSRFKGDQGSLPLESASPDEIMEFIQRLNRKDRARLHRLPTEAEWEYACRAGSATSYHFGDDPKMLAEYCWYWGTAGFRTHPVGQKKANPWGLYDLHGNVWEICGDWYDSAYYDRSPSQDPEGPPEGQVRVARGGSFLDSPSDCRSARRGKAKTGMGYGFRLVVEAKR